MIELSESSLIHDASNHLHSNPHMHPQLDPHSNNVSEYEVVSSIFASVRSGAVDRLESLLKDYPDIDINLSDAHLPRIFSNSTPDITGRAVIHWAAELGDIAVLRCLFEKCSNLHLDSRDNSGQTPLLLAARQGQLECVKFLLDHDSIVSWGSLQLLGSLPVGRSLIDNLFRAHQLQKRSFLETMRLWLAFLEVTVQSRTALNNYVLKTIELDLEEEREPLETENKSTGGDTPFSRILLHNIEWVYFLPAMLRWQVALKAFAAGSVSEAVDLGETLMRRIDETIAALFDSECFDHEVVVLQQLLLLHPRHLPPSLHQQQFGNDTATSQSNPMLIGSRPVELSPETTVPSRTAAANLNSPVTAQTDLPLEEDEDLTNDILTDVVTITNGKLYPLNQEESIFDLSRNIDIPLLEPHGPHTLPNLHSLNHPQGAITANYNSENIKPLATAEILLRKQYQKAHSEAQIHTLNLSPNLQQLPRGDLAWLNRPPALYAACLAEGSLLDFALTHNLKAIFDMTQVSSIVDKVFRKNARVSLEQEQHPRRRLFQWLLTIRFCPRNILILEFLSQLAMLALMWQVSVNYGHMCRDQYRAQCPSITGHSHSWTHYEVALSVFVFTELCYEAGLTISGREHKIFNLNSLVSALSNRFRDDLWNLVDAIAVLGGVFWFIFRCLSPEFFSVARVLLSLLAIPQSLGVLRYLSLYKALGELVIIIRAMMNDLFVFLVVYLVFILGFGIAFRGLFIFSSAYDSNSNTFLTLFDSTMLYYDFSVLNSDSEFINGLGVLLTVVTVTGTSVVLLNLLIAQMWETNDRIRAQSVREWCFYYAHLVQRLSNWREKNVYCMLPSPLNLFTIVFSCFGLISIVDRHHNEACWGKVDQERHSRPVPTLSLQANSRDHKGQFVSVGGTVANCLLAYLCYPLALIHRTYVVVTSSSIYNVTPVAQSKRRRKSTRKRRCETKSQQKPYSSKFVNHDKQDHYQRYVSDESLLSDSDSNHESDSDSESDATDEDVAATKKNVRRGNSRKRWLENLLLPKYHRNRPSFQTWSEKCYFICVVIPVLVLLWPFAPLVAAELAHYPLLELVDSRDAIFLPPQYRNSASSWDHLDAHSEEKVDEQQESAHSIPAKNAAAKAKFQASAEQGSSVSSSIPATTVNKLRAHGETLRHVESSWQMLAERSKSVSAPPVMMQTQTLSQGATNSLPDAQNNSKINSEIIPSELLANFFMRQDVDRILLPLVRNTTAVDLDTLAKKSLAKQTQLSSQILESRLQTLDIRIHEILRTQQAQQEVLQLLAAQMRDLQTPKL